MADLKTSFCGIKAPNPFWLSSSSVSNTAEMVIRAFEEGWGGAVFKSLSLNEEVRLHNTSPCFAAIGFEDKNFLGLENIELFSERPFSENLIDLKEIKKRFPDRALIASLAVTPKKEECQELAIKVQKTGVDGLELNFSCPNVKTGGGAGRSIGKNPELVARIIGWIKEVSKVPVLAKLTASITDIRKMAVVAKEAGADGISAINTIPSIIGVDLETLIPKPTVDGKTAIGGYSGPAIKPIALRCVAEIAMDKEIGLPISGIGGITTWQDAAEFILLGSTSVQVTTAIMRYGYRIVEDLIDGLSNWMDEKGIKKLDDMVGKSLSYFTNVESLNRNYKMVSTIDKKACVKCGLCYIVCQDAGHQAITLDENKFPIIDKEKCGGCSLCSLICPVMDCIVMKTV